MSEYIVRMQSDMPYEIKAELNAWYVNSEPIVRCRDCKHFTPKGTHKFENGKTNADYCTYVRGWLLQITPEGFCAWAERREP